MNSTEVIDKSVWKQLIEFDNGQAKFFLDLIGIFLETTPEYFVKLEAAKRAGNFKELNYYSHIMKSSCRTVGAMSLANYLEKIEKSSHTGIDDVGEKEWQEIKALTAKVLSQLTDEQARLAKAK